jgi:hypothetical protein
MQILHPGGPCLAHLVRSLGSGVTTRDLLRAEAEQGLAGESEKLLP